MTAPFFRRLSKEEYNKLSLEERMWYMRQLIEHVRHRLEETREQMEQNKKLIPPEEKNE